MTKPLFNTAEWSFELLERTWEVINKVATKKFGLDYYDPQIEIITSEQMLNNYSSVAMPIMYSHWSFGKTFVRNDRAYQKGIQGLAYEVVINTNPCIAYLMENNTMTMQTLVMAHALCGHGSFFKHNYLFKKWTDAESIIDYLKFARNYIKDCEYKYGEQEVEELLDACHSLKYNSVDKYKKPPSLKSEISHQRQKDWNQYFEQTFNDLWRTLPKKPEAPISDLEIGNYKFPEENILYFLEKHSPILKPWEREICRIVRKLAQYFYPQMQTGLMNEGWACFCHHLLMTELHNQGYITDGSYLEFLASHTNVVAQPNWTRQYFRGINVYALGFAIFQDIKRMCQDPTAEDKYWCPTICNTDWLSTCIDIMKNYRDESFILQFLSPKVIRDFKLFVLASTEGQPYLKVSAIHNDEDVLHIRKVVAAEFDINKKIPRVEITQVDSDRWLYLEHISDSILEYNNMKATASYINDLWGYPVKMIYKNLQGEEIDEV